MHSTALRRSLALADYTLNKSDLALQTFAKPKESMFANIATEWHHPDASQYEVKNSPMRPADVWFTALGTSHGHG
jgi:hypothetical protein